MPLIEYLLFKPGPAGPQFDRWGGVFLGVYVGIALATIVLYVILRAFSARHALRSRVAQRILTFSLLLQATGVLLLGLRLANLPFFSMRLFLYAHMIAEVYAVGYLLWWMQKRYPDLLAQYEWEDRKRAYLPRAAGGTVAPARRKAAARRA